jgi:hypothetical protein
VTAPRLTLSIRDLRDADARKLVRHIDDLRAVLPDVVMPIPAGRTESEAMVLALEHTPRRTP